MQELENKKAALVLLLNETNDKLNDYKAQISMLQKDIDDYNKPELTPAQLDNIHEAVENVVNDFDFEDTDNYNIEYELDYDGRVSASSLEFQNTYELVEKIVDKVYNLFKEADCPTDEENERDDREAEQVADQINKVQ
tara:strand:+ start:72 stop:485 length:414 start_codon:yes stop_codon:yes gene_type:complete